LSRRLNSPDGLAVLRQEVQLHREASGVSRCDQFLGIGSRSSLFVEKATLEGIAEVLQSTALCLDGSRSTTRFPAQTATASLFMFQCLSVSNRSLMD
jgi:hypothetical protein